MPYGLLDTGLAIKRREDILADVRARVATAPALGANVNTDAESPLGQILEIMAGAMAEVWEAADAVYASADPLTARGVALDNVAQRYALARERAVASTVTLTLAGTPGTLIPGGSAVTLGADRTRWVLLEDRTIGGGGNIAGPFEAADTGPLRALAGSSWSIATPVSGWSGATNSTDAVVGRDAESDASLRARALQAAVTGGRAAEAIRSAMLRVRGVTEAVVIENDTNSPDADGRPMKSIEVVVRGGTDQAVADALWSSKPSGIETVSTVSGPVVASVVDGNGATQSVTFSRADAVTAYVEIDYAPRLGVFPSNGETLMRDAILAFGAGLRIGTGVSPEDVRQALLCPLPSGSLRSLVLRMGVAPSPPSAVEIPTTRTSLAVFDSSRIAITRVN
jgi:uncharacterized phage protein gp47/JayE